MIQSVLTIAVVGGIALAAAAVGTRILAWGGGSPAGRWVTFAVGTALGMGVLGFAVLLLGTAGWLFTWSSALVLGGAILLWLPQIRGLAIRATRGGERGRGPSRVEWGMLAFLGAAAALNLAGALAPPTGVDDLAYHLALPKLFVEAHRIEFLPSHRLSATPMQMEMLYTLALAVRSAAAAQVLNWYLGIVCLGTVIHLGSVVFNRTAGLVAGALFYATNSVTFLSTSGAVELGSTLFALGSTLALLGWKRAGSRRWLLTAGILAGLMASTKLPNLLTTIVLAAVVAGTMWRTASAKRALASASVFALAAVTVAGVWYARSWLLTGNPAYPYLSTIFGGAYLPVGRMVGGPDLTVIGRSDPLLTPGTFLAYRDPLKFIVSPWTLTMDELRYRGFPGPLFLGLLPAVAVQARRLSPAARFLLLLSGAFYVGWFFGYSLLRNALPALALLALPTGAICVAALGERRWLRRLVAGSLGLWLAVSLAGTLEDHAAALPVALGLESEQAYLVRRLPEPDRAFPYYAAYQHMNTQLPPGSRVLLWDSRGFYLDRPYVRSWEFLTGLADPDRLRTPAGALVELRRWGITHVAMTGEGKRLWFTKLLWSSGRLRCTFDDGAMQVCALQEPPT